GARAGRGRAQPVRGVLFGGGERCERNRTDDGHGLQNRVTPGHTDHRIAAMRRSAPGFLVASLLPAIATPLMAQGFGGTVSDILVRADSLLAQNRANEAIVQYQEARTL